MLPIKVTEQRQLFSLLGKQVLFVKNLQNIAIDCTCDMFTKNHNGNKPLWLYCVIVESAMILMNVMIASQCYMYFD